MKNLFVFAAVITIVFFSSCRATKTIQSAIVKKDSTAILAINSEKARLDSIEFIRENYKQVMSHHINFTSFSAKMDVDYEDANGKNMSFNAQVRMYKDSVIWVSITAIFGIEGLRAYITPDSVKILDKQNKVYIARSVSYLQEISALPLNLSSLQDLLIGNPMFMDSSFTSYSTAPSTISLKGNNEFFKILLTISDADKLVVSTKLDDADEQRSRTSYLDYSEYENGNGVYFPKKRTITVSEKKRLNVKLNFKQYAFNEMLSFPFTVPKNYRRD